MPGHRFAEPPVTYATPMMLPMQQPYQQQPYQQQQCVQQFVVYGSGPEPSMPAMSSAVCLPPQAMQSSQQFGRQVIQLPPAVSEQANAEGKYHFPSAMAQELDFDLSPPPPPPAGAPTLPHLYTQTRQHTTLPPPPPSLSPRLQEGQRDVVL